MERHQRGPAVVVMARVPRPGEGKRRLRGALADEEVRRLQEAFLRDAVETAQAAQVGPVYLAHTPPDAGAWVLDTLGPDVRPFPQRGDDLGARLLAALRHVEALGHAPLLVIGTDTLLLRPRHLQAARRALRGADVCFGPSEDGGYYLLACRTVPPQLFTDIPWGTDQVLAVTLLRARVSGLRTCLLEPLYDIDRPDDLARLRDDLASMPASPALLPRHTAAALHHLS